MVTGLAFRLSLYYGVLFVAVGIYTPFWPLWLESRGLDAVEIGIVSAAGIAAKALSGPVVAHWADRSGERRRIMLTLVIVATGTFGLLGTATGFPMVLLLTLPYMLAWAPVMPLGESLTMLEVRQSGLTYSRIRVWGSATFILAAAATGHFLVGRDADLVFWMLLISLAALAGAVAWLPDRKAPRATGRLPLASVLRVPGFGLFLLAGSMIQGSHAVYYTFATLHWRGAGYSADLIGALWAEGVIAEIVLFTAGVGLIRKAGPRLLLLVGATGAAVRWLVLGATVDLPWLILAQTLHALTFGATHLGAIHFIARAVPPQLSATAQSLYSAVVMGVAFGAAVLLAGPLYHSFGGGAFLAMSAIAAAGIVAAFLLGRDSGDSNSVT
jgi:PPP family 3-phenylpropionic acid transporter